MRATDSTVQAVTRRAARDVEDTLNRALANPGQARRAAELLRELAGLLLRPAPQRPSGERTVAR